MIKSINIGSRTFISDLRLPGKTDIIFLSLIGRLLISVLLVVLFSINGCPTKVLYIFSSSKYFFSKSNNKRI